MDQQRTCELHRQDLQRVPILARSAPRAPFLVPNSVDGIFVQGNEGEAGGVELIFPLQPSARPSQSRVGANPGTSSPERREDQSVSQHFAGIRNIRMASFYLQSFLQPRYPSVISAF